MKVIAHFLVSPWFAILTIGLGVVCFPLIDVCGNNGGIKIDLYSIAKDLKSGSLSIMEIISISDMVTDMSVKPQIFDEMVGDKVTPSMIMSQCELSLSSEVDSSLAPVFSQAAETVAASTEPRDIYWRIRFFAASNELKYTIYMGTWYKNATDVGVVINYKRANVDQKLEKWFENNIDYERCVFRPSA
jgi:hypothetical protein